MNGLAIGEPVRVRLDQRSAVPAAFTWRGAWHEVRRWRRAAGRRGPGRRWEVHTMGGMACVLVRGPGEGEWRLERVLDARGGRA